MGFNFGKLVQQATTSVAKSIQNGDAAKVLNAYQTNGVKGIGSIMVDKAAGEVKRQAEKIATGTGLPIAPPAMKSGAMNASTANNSTFAAFLDMPPPTQPAVPDHVAKARPSFFARLLAIFGL